MSGCGYSLLAEKPLLGAGYKRMSIPVFVNKTLEPGIEEVVTQAVVNEFLLDSRVSVEYSKNAECILSGKVILYQTNQAISYDSLNRIAEYRLTLSISVEIREKDNTLLWKNKNITVTADYTVPQQITEIKNAEDRALRVASAKIAGNLIRLIERF